MTFCLLSPCSRSSGQAVSATSTICLHASNPLFLDAKLSLQAFLSTTLAHIAFISYKICEKTDDSGGSSISSYFQSIFTRLLSHTSHNCKCTHPDNNLSLTDTCGCALYVIQFRHQNLMQHFHVTESYSG